MTVKIKVVSRGKGGAKRNGDEPIIRKAAHYIKCAKCGGWIDMRDPARMQDHTGPLPHPMRDQPQ